MFELTPEQVEFQSKLELWCGLTDRKLEALHWIEGVRLQGAYICLELVDDNGDSAEFAISFTELVKQHGEFIKYSHRDDAEESKVEVLKALRDAIETIEGQQSTLAGSGST